MDRDVSEYIGYLIFFIIFVLPRVLRFFAKQKKASPGKPIKPMSVPTLEEILNGKPAEPPPPTYTATEVAAFKEKVTRLEKELASLSSETLDLVQFANARGGPVQKMAAITENTLSGPLSRLENRLRRLAAADDPNETEAAQIRQILDRQRTALGLLRQMAEQRTKPDRSDLLGILDTACKEALMPFRVHAGRMNLPFKTEYVLSVMDDAGADFAALLQKSKVAVAVVDQKFADIPKGWINLISDVGMDVCYSTKGLKARLDADLGTLAPPRSVGHYRDPRALVAGLISAWLPRIFGDITATLYLGPGAISGMQALYNADETLLAQIGADSGQKLPLHVRVYVTARVLAHMGLQDLANDKWEAWQRQLGAPATLTLKDQGNVVDIPVDPLLSAVGRTVDYLIAEPLPLFGNYPLAHVPSLICNLTTIKRMEAMAPYLIRGEARNAPTRIVIGAALLAQDKSPTAERRIGHAALTAMAGKGIIDSPSAFERGDRYVPSVIEAAHIPAMASQAIALGTAVAPRRVPRLFG